MNKTVVFITFTALAAVAIITATVLMILRPDASATLVNLIGTVLAIAAGFAATVYGLGKQNEKLEQQDETLAKISTQTNGNLSEKEQENRRLTNIIIAAGLNPDKAGPAHARE